MSSIAHLLLRRLTLIQLCCGSREVLVAARSLEPLSRWGLIADECSSSCSDLEWSDDYQCWWHLLEQSLQLDYERQRHLDRFPSRYVSWLQSLNKLFGIIILRLFIRNRIFVLWNWQLCNWWGYHREGPVQRADHVFVHLEQETVDERVLHFRWEVGVEFYWVSCLILKLCWTLCSLFSVDYLEEQPKREKQNQLAGQWFHEWSSVLCSLGRVSALVMVTWTLTTLCHRGLHICTAMVCFTSQKCWLLMPSLSSFDVRRNELIDVIILIS